MFGQMAISLLIFHQMTIYFRMFQYTIDSLNDLASELSPWWVYVVAKTAPLAHPGLKE